MELEKSGNKMLDWLVVSIDIHTYYIIIHNILVGGFKHEWIIFHNIWDVILPID